MKRKKKVNTLGKPKKPKKKPPYNKNSAIRSALRRTFSRSPMVTEVKMAGRREVPRFNKDGSRAKRDKVEFQCEVCGSWVSSKDIAVDHIDPVVIPEIGFPTIDGEDDWNTYIKRLWSDRSNLQRICPTCHDKKSAKEREIRTETNRNKKKENK